MAAEDTKRKLVEAAYKMLMEEGFENVKARNVAKEAGYAATAIYKHFGSLNFLTTLASFKLLDDSGDWTYLSEPWFKLYRFLQH